jgi:hypothetical protein
MYEIVKLHEIKMILGNTFDEREKSRIKTWPRGLASLNNFTIYSNQAYI